MLLPMAAGLEATDTRIEEDAKDFEVFDPGIISILMDRGIPEPL